MKIVCIFLRALLLLTAVAVNAANVEVPGCDLHLSGDGTFIGTSAIGGVTGDGSIFRISPESEITVLFEFTGVGGAGRGAFPRAGVIADASGQIWGTTEQGGTSDLGTVFKFDPATLTLITVVDFTGANGSFPQAALVAGSDGNLWGTTTRGGTNDQGIVFKIVPETGALTKVAEFTGTAGAVKGSQPKAALILASDGLLWGSTSAGGPLSLGTIFNIDPDTGIVTTVTELTGSAGSALGSAPSAALVEAADGSLWGSTTRGGNLDFGTIFRLDPATGVFTTVFDFSNSDGAYPRGRLLADGAGAFWGTTSDGGTSNLGTAFKIDAMTHALSTVVSFTGASGASKGAYPLAGLTSDGLATFWGTTSHGGRDDRGTIYRLAIADGAYRLVAEPNTITSPPSATVKRPPASLTKGLVGGTVLLQGTAQDNVELFSVIVSVNGGRFFPATLTLGSNLEDVAKWDLAIVPENGVNIAVIKSVDNGGDPSKPIVLSFVYKVARPELAGSYNGLVQSTAVSATPFQHTGIFGLAATSTGSFSGKLQLGGAKAHALKGTFGNTGTLRFGNTGATLLSVPRKNLPPLQLAMSVGVNMPLSRKIAGNLKEHGVVVGQVNGDQALYTAKKNPEPPFLNVPATLLDPASDRGAYTGVFTALTPAAQGLPAEQFPQGDGYARLKISKSGRVTITGKLADGTAISAANALSLEDVLPFFASFSSGTGAISGPVQFRDLARSDADALGLKWFRAPDSKAASYRNGWPRGIETDFVGSKFVAPAISGMTPLGNSPSNGAANALLAISAGDLAVPLHSLLAIRGSGQVTTLGAPTGGTAPANLHVTLASTGLLTGNFQHPSTQRATAFNGAVLQKTQRTHGYFLSGPKGSPKQSGRVEIEAQ